MKGNQDARKELYNLYAPKMMSICRRYMANEEEAKDVFQQAFFNVFKNLEQLKESKTLSGWIKRIFVNAALAQLNNKKRLFLSGQMEEMDRIELSTPNHAIDNLAVEVILNLIEKLPSGARTVFNLFAIEGFSHKEIAEQLTISVGTSKSQLFDARKQLQKWIIEKNEINRNNKPS